MDTKRAIELARRLIAAEDAIIRGENYFAVKCALALARDMREWGERYDAAPFTDAEDTSSRAPELAAVPV